MRKIKLTKEEKNIEDALLKGEYVDVPKSEFKRITKIIIARKKQKTKNQY